MANDPIKEAISIISGDSSSGAIDELSGQLSSDLCSPESQSGVPFSSIDADCHDLGIPRLASPTQVDTSFLDGLSSEQSAVLSKTQGCIDKVEEVNSEVRDQIERYEQNRILLEKLIEYRDNYAPVQIYYEEFSKEAARLVGLFQPLLIRLSAIEEQFPALISERQTASPARQLEINSQLDVLNSEANDIRIRLQDQAESNLSITKSLEFRQFSAYVNQAPSLDETQPVLLKYFGDLIDRELSIGQYSVVNEQLSAYSEGLSAKRNFNIEGTVRSVINKPGFFFDIKFLHLDGITLQREKYDLATGNRTNESYLFPIKDSPLLTVDSFFDDGDVVRVSRFDITRDPTGSIYTGYYNLMSDPINGFFDPDERGLTVNVNLVDPRVSGTSAAVKRDGPSEYYVRDLDKMQAFYEDFEQLFIKRKDEVRARVITNAKNGLRLTISDIVKKEVQILFAAGQLNQYLPTERPLSQAVYEALQNRATQASQASVELDSEITRLTELVKELRPTPEKIQALLKTKSPDCFGRLDEQSQDCSDTLAKVGSDPSYAKTIGGADPALPNFTQMCYWKQFAKAANRLGLSPVPNKSNPTTLRYWPIGLTIPSPSGLVKIPLPIVWKPLVSIASSFGTMVTFLTVNGVFVSPVVFLISSSGFKQHVMTVRGPSRKFGADPTQLKPEIFKSISSLANDARIARSNQDPLARLSPEQRVRVETTRNVLTKRVELTAGDPDLNAKAKKELASFERSLSAETPIERAQAALDKAEGPEDAIQSAKVGLSNRLNDLGRPPMPACDAIKDRIVSRRDRLQSDLYSALESGDLVRTQKIRLELLTDGVSLDEKRAAIEADTLAHLDRVELPKISLPRDPSIIDPKPNSIDMFSSSVEEFSSVNKSTFYSLDQSDPTRVYSKEMAKLKSSILSSEPSSFSSLDLESLRAFMRSVNAKVTDSMIGKSGLTDFDRDRQDMALGLTRSSVDLIAKTRVKTDGFAPCCETPVFKLDTSDKPAVGVHSSIKSTLDSRISSMTDSDLLSVFGDRTTLTSEEAYLSYMAIAKSWIPRDVQIPIPALDLNTFTQSFSGVLSSLSETRVPIPEAVGSISSGLKLDLNSLMPSLRSEIVSDLQKSLPSSGGSDSSLTSISCSTEEPESTLLDPASPSQPEVSSFLPARVYPAFQHIESDFMSIGPSDISSYLKTTLFLKLDGLASKLAPAYSVISSVKGLKGVSMNVLDAAQYAALPFGPGARSIFSQIAEIKRDSPRSANFMIIDDSALEIDAPTIESSMAVLVDSPALPIIISDAGSNDSVFPDLETVSEVGGTVRVSKVQPAKSAIRSRHPLVDQDDLPSWERLSDRNPLFLLFLDDFVSAGADQVGFFRSFA